jgi:predicted  nucleic acid-binding Zn-ribbon protein
MRPGELLLRYWRLEDRMHADEQAVERLASQLERDPEVERLGSELETARRVREEARLRLASMEREVAGHRGKVRQRNAELMSGRIRNPTELMQMSEEVEHMRARLAAEEDAELEVMAEVEDAEAAVTRLELALDEAKARAAEAAPNLRRQLEHARAEYEQSRAEHDALWAQVPPQYQSAYRRLRVQPPVAEVVGTQCAACHVTVTSSQLQHLRRGDEVINCDNCGRLLVAA